MYKEMKMAIEIENLGKMYKLYKKNSDKVRDAFGLNFWRKNYYQEYWALREINIQIKKGERVGLIGHNGAGKSTLLKIIIGNLEPTEGKIFIDGKIQALMELGTGFHPDFTGKENIRASLAYNGLTLTEIRSKEDEIIDFAELGDYIDQPVKTYSAGMYARLAFSTATAIEPEVLIIDEVLGAGDAYFSGKCIERMKSLTGNADTTVLFVSHDLASVQALCERVIWIDKGRIRYDGDALTAIKKYSDTVREKQENKLRIRDRKVQEKQAVVLDKEEDLYLPVLFRLCGMNDFKAYIRRIVLYKEKNEVAAIDVGMPMDNNIADHNHILEEKNLMCWGVSEKDERGYFRIVDNKVGKYRHAPFILTIGKLEELKQKFTLKVYGEIKEGDNFEVSIYDKKLEDYRVIGKLYSDNLLESQPIQFQMDEETEINKKDILVENTVDKGFQDVEKGTDFETIEFQDSAECQIIDAGIYDQDRKKRRVFPFDNPISFFEFTIKFIQKMEQFSFAFLIFTIRGDIVLSQCQDVIKGMDEEYRIRIKLGDLRLGPGIYTISFGVYDNLEVMDDSKPQSAIALIDRGMSFEIERPLDYQLGLGNVLPKMEICITDKKGETYQCYSKI